MTKGVYSIASNHNAEQLTPKTPSRKVVVGKKAFFQAECIDMRDVDSLDEDVVVQGVPVATVCRVLYMIEPCVQVGYLDPEITWYSC